MKKNISPLDIFFLCMGIDACISAFKVKFDDLTVPEIINNLFLSFMYNFAIALPAAITAMIAVIVGRKLAEYLKKKLKK